MSYDEIFIIYEYDSQRHLMKRHTSYTLDHHGNWTTLEEGGGTFLRTITYYDK